VAPGRVAQPPFSKYWPCCQLEETSRRAARFSLSAVARHALAVDTAPALQGLREAHRANLAVNRARHGF
jgi:hypothetical protein